MLMQQVKHVKLGDGLIHTIDVPDMYGNNIHINLIAFQLGNIPMKLYVNRNCEGKFIYISFFN